MGEVCMATLRGHKDWVLSVATSKMPTDRPGTAAASHAEDWIISSSMDNSIRFWDPVTYETELVLQGLALQGHKNSGIRVDTSSINGQRRLAAACGHQVYIWSY
ncbi:hypothetical protein MGN70_011970 [Eutypa lata]|nr:hypothetical protein MGN70_011970 [Eutypa lata]